MLNRLEAVSMASKFVKTYEDLVLGSRIPSEIKVPTLAILGTLLKQYAATTINVQYFHMTLFIAIHYCHVNKASKTNLKQLKRNLEYLFEDCQKVHPRLPPKNS